MNTKLCLAASQWSRIFAGLALFVGAFIASTDALAATARVRWLPRSTNGVSGYRVYIRNGGATYPSTAQWSGNPTPAADGSLTADVSYTPAASGVNYFTVVAFDATTESGLAPELWLGAPPRCRADNCTTKTGCNFTQFTDGTPCDDALFCNGSETCQSGVCASSGARNCADAIACTVDSCDETLDRCTHSGPPGCCVACDSNDPCLADACANGDCSAPSGTDLDVNRVRLLKKKQTVMLAAKGRFVADQGMDPTVAGATVQLRTADGAILYSSTSPGTAFQPGTSGGRYRFTATGAQAQYVGNGITRLDFRFKGDGWLVTLKAATPYLADALLESPLTWSIDMGDVCVRRMDLPCEQTDVLSVCR